MSNPVDYFQEAFGGFAPHRDRDAALKFALDELVVERRFDDLLCLVKGGPDFGGVEGEPGWIIQRRAPGKTVGYERWPADCLFRAHVDPVSYSLKYPEFLRPANPP